MNLKLFKLIIILSFISLSFLPSNLFSQAFEREGTSGTFYFDAICFKSDLDSLGRVDIFTVVPYQTLSFFKTGDNYSASYDLTISIYDENSNIVETKTQQRKLFERDYNIALGSNASFDYTQNIFFLKPGKYEITVEIIDNFSKKFNQRSRVLTVLNFNDFNFSLSGLMLVSSIEEREGRFKITPHLSENVGDLTDGFFIFFESYSKLNLESVDYFYELINSNGEVVEKSKKISRNSSANVNRNYIRIILPQNILQGGYTLRLTAMKQTNDENDYNPSGFLAVTERSIRIFRSISGVIISDLNKSIKQLRYVATQEEIDYIEAGATIEEKQSRFEQFWKKLDPTPNTDRNEAYEEYYARVDYANKNFRSYVEGWRTDKGMVFIIFGKPYNVERQTPYGDNRVFERWTYTNNRQFIFVDINGFGDFRLYQPPSISEKYRYER
ncbi:MAG: GWxTD domain-containing protein [Candidatus Kapabacteria bacterium]|nr:GWxTD domain-containing protein [Candidatus Kapabacteria bacterium]